jgi:D-beta-D-heptose 7-phosphate kinase/D-beta-D-heptose 1-phosphate adenosyltransferase
MITSTLPNFANASVLVIGDVMLDRYWFGDTGRISPEAPVPIVKIKQTDERPGGAGNVALNIAALGAKVTLLGVVGNDEAGASLDKQLAASGVISALQHITDVPTITKLRVISRHQQLIRLDFEETFPQFSPDHLLQAYAEHLKHVNLVILSDYNKGTLADPQAFITLAQQANIPILVDPKGTNFNLYQGAQVITPNLKEFEDAMGHCQSEQDILQKGLALLDHYKITALLLTRGEQGMTLITHDGEVAHLPAHAREVFDVTGAGDTVIALLGACLAAGETLNQAMNIANLAAGMVVAKLGAATITAAELEVALHGLELPASVCTDEDALLAAVLHAQTQGKKVVFTNGCFDILHAGHVNYLQQAKQLGDYLIVAVNNDASVSSLKGTSRPINRLAERMTVLAGLGAVDWVISFSDATPNRLLKRLQPDILVKGGDYSIEQVVGHEIVSAYGGDVRVLGMTKGASTTATIQRMVDSALESTNH